MSNKHFIFESETNWLTVGEGVRRQILGFDEQMMMVKVEFQANAVGYVHSHEHRQCTYVASGIFEFRVGEETKIVKAGDGIYMEPNVPHGVKCLETGVLIDTFNPMRADFI